MKQFDLQTRLDAYLALREALGIRTHASKLVLQDFVRYLEQHADGPRIRAQLAIDWACNSSTVRGISGQATRLSFARGFLAHLKASFPETEIPDTSLIAAPRRSTPYIFSAFEIGAVLASAERLTPGNSLRPHTHQTLFGLMACTGLRPSEAIKLLVSDIELNEAPPRLLIRDTKFKKSRWVALHPSAAESLRRYVQLRRDLQYDALSDVFFVSEQGKQLNYFVLRRTFQRLLRRIGIVPRPGQRRPTLHSFRHTFAVQRLRSWYETGSDVRGLSPNLSVYLGHIDPAASYWYLTATPELLGSALHLFESYTDRGGAE